MLLITITYETSGQKPKTTYFNSKPVNLACEIIKPSVIKSLVNLDAYINLKQLAANTKQFGKEIGFDHVGITDTNVDTESKHFENWIQSGNHGSMSYLERHLKIFKQPEKLLSIATRVICYSMHYPKPRSPNHHIASFAQVQDYSTHIRQLLKKCVDKLLEETQNFQKTRAFSGNAPILEKSLAAKAGLGWYGKNSILINQNLGSYFFLGEILTNIPLPIDKPTTNRCGDCFKCKDACPTKAIVAPHKIDARRCISYLTIEHKNSIPIELRPLIGTKIFGCDLCQQACPWNNKLTNQKENTFTISAHFKSEDLVTWFLWSEKEFLDKTKESSIRRIGHERWLRNIAIALGNSPKNEKITKALKSRLNHPSPLVSEHIKWALSHRNRSIGVI